MWKRKKEKPHSHTHTETSNLIRFRKILFFLTSKTTRLFSLSASLFLRRSCIRTLINMPPKTALDEMGKKGEFVRTDSAWRKKIGEGEFLAEANRYRLYVSFACPWASRCLMGLALKGLTEVIPVTVVGPVWKKTRPEDDSDEHWGWPFVTPEEFPRCSLDPNGSKTLRELYEKAGDTHHKYSVPVLWDEKLKTIVNNESSEILRMLDTEFNEFAKHPNVRLYPKHLQKKIDEVNEWVYPLINNGVYRSGFATSQEAYDGAVQDVFNGLDRVEQILSSQRYLVGNRFTEADVRLFVTIVRFDSVYTTHFKCNKKCVSDYPNISNYIRDIYQMEGIRNTVDLQHIKNHYYRSHPKINPFRIVAVGPDENFDLPHDRHRFPAESTDGDE